MIAKGRRRQIFAQMRVDVSSDHRFKKRMLHRRDIFIYRIAEHRLDNNFIDSIFPALNAVSDIPNHT